MTVCVEGRRATKIVGTVVRQTVAIGVTFLGLYMCIMQISSIKSCLASLM